MVSLRGELRLLALRGPLLLDGVEDDDFPLAVGQVITLAEGVSLEVVEVVVPERGLALQAGGEVWPLRAPTYSLLLEPQPQLVPRYHPHAAARVWSGAEGWLLQVGAPGATTVVLSDHGMQVEETSLFGAWHSGDGFVMARGPGFTAGADLGREPSEGWNTLLTGGE